MIVVALLYCHLFRHVCLLSLRSLFFFNERQKCTGTGGEGRGEGTRRVKGGETITRIHCKRKEDVFNKGGTRKKTPYQKKKEKKKGKGKNSTRLHDKGPGDIRNR